MLIQRIMRWLASIVIVVSIIFSAWYVMNGDLVFHSDIARDFVLMEQMVSERKLSLIGEGIRDIPGLYHGPAWLYVNLPAFIVGGGNPIVVGWGWVAFEMLFLYSVYWMSKRIFSPQVGLIITSIVATKIPLFAHQLINPSGAFLLFPTFFYFLWKYSNYKKVVDLIIATILSGLLIQCEIVFGLPMFLSLALMVLFKVVKKSVKISHIFYLGVILVPLSTYLFFDFRHNFVQIKTAWTYITSARTEGWPLTNVILNRVSEIWLTLGVMLGGTKWMNHAFSILFYFCLWSGIRTNNKNGFFGLYLFISVVFWSFSLMIPGKIQGYYFDFSVLNTMILVSQLYKLRGHWWVIIVLPLWLFNLNTAKLIAYSVNQTKGQVESSWQFNKQLGEKIVKDAPDDFSVFTLGTDIWGYSPRYGISYAAKEMNKTVNMISKSEITYLVIAKDTIDHPLFDVRWWKEDQIKIKKAPTSTWFKGSLIIEKYHLTADEVAVSEDPLLMSTNTSLR